MDADLQARAMARQQLCRCDERVPNRQADAGAVAQKTTTANSNNAPFLPDFMVYKSQAFTASVCHRDFRGSDLNHTHLD
jgi:hypothetical protein